MIQLVQKTAPFYNETVCVPARMWTLMKSDDVELRYLIQSGKAFMTQLDGAL